jgi:hypothetical protein
VNIEKSYRDDVWADEYTNYLRRFRDNALKVGHTIHERELFKDKFCVEFVYNHQVEPGSNGGKIDSYAKALHELAKTKLKIDGDSEDLERLDQTWAGLAIRILVGEAQNFTGPVAHQFHQ